MVNVLKFYSYRHNFHQCFLPIFIIFSFLPHLHVCYNLYKIEIHDKLLLFHWRVTYLVRMSLFDYKLYFSAKSAEQWNLDVAHEKCKYSVINY